MSAVLNPKSKSIEGKNASKVESLPSSKERLAEALAAVESVVPPLWPLQDYVAVNPFLGLSKYTFHSARQALRSVRDCELLPSLDFFRQQIQSERISRKNIASALEQCLKEYPDWYADYEVEWILRGIESGNSMPAAKERHYFTLSEWIDRREHSSWTSHIINDITRHCSSYYDEGQASWPNPWKELPLYTAWREGALLSRRMDYLGIKGFHDLIAQLPSEPRKAIVWVLHELGISPVLYRHFLLCEILSVAGWASFVKYRDRQAAMAGQVGDELISLLAIRLAYDLALARSHVAKEERKLRDFVAEIFPSDSVNNLPQAPPTDVLVRYLLQVATETAYRKKLLGQLTAQQAPAKTNEGAAVQMIFCIDVRSEVMRRHLESLSDKIETFGFAGFFAMPFEYVPFGQASGMSQCPVLLSPSFRVKETVQGVDGSQRDRAMTSFREQRTKHKIWKSFQSSAVSCFSFVESIGLLYFFNLVADSLRFPFHVLSGSRNRSSRHGAATIGPDLHAHGDDHLPLARKVDLAEGMLRNLGLTECFSRLIIICGHASEVTNNPYKAGLDCGACGGHSGEPNARVAAALLNDRQVRQVLATLGISIPEDTWFVPAVHNTTTDEIRMFDTNSLPATHSGDLAEIKRWIAEAAMLCRKERSCRLNGATASNLVRRSRDWAEVRPEWGLAGNASFIVAPRSRTKGLNLGGRSFLHSYDHEKDPDLKVLELIMTAPMIVANWINLQYYASTVDNRSFGSGNKVIHNVVGQFGVLQGNGGDLMTGLPWQSISDGSKMQHEPLRLLVVIEATRQAVKTIINKHTLVKELTSNGWLTLVVLENEVCYRWSAPGSWEVDTTSVSNSRGEDKSATAESMGKGGLQ